MTNSLSDTDLRAIADQLGPQYALLHCPPITLPWFSSDDTVALAADRETGDIRIATTRPMSRETRAEVATALVSTLLGDQADGSDQ